MQTYQPAKLLRLYVTESDRYQEKALHEAILEKCRELKIAGATVFRGIEGYGETAEIHRAHLLGHDLPIVVQIVDTPDNIERVLPAIEGMLDKGLIAISDVSALRIRK
jgi:uncharacterized protein